jgi:phage shock protein C
MTKKLTRSSNKVLAGVCGGIAEYFGIDPTVVRVCYAALSVFAAGFPGILLYIIMLLLIPEKDPKDNIPDAEVVE